jgi:quercetin dioxygenase-like cupin family protein
MDLSAENNALTLEVAAMATLSTAQLFRWENLPTDTPMPLIQRRRIIGEKMMISEIRLAKGCVVPTHAHENEQISCILSGALKFGIGAEGSPERHEVIVKAGETLVLPSHVPHGAEALEDTLALDLFSPPSASTGIDRKG